MAELMEPFERELRRSRRQPQSAQMQQWFEDDMALALDQLAARTGNARTLGALQPGDEAKGIIAREAPRPGAATIGEMIANPVREPENPEAVRRELIDPLVSAYGMDGQAAVRRQSAPLIREVGNNVLRIDPMTGQVSNIFQAPEKPDNRAANFDQRVILGKISALQAAKNDPATRYSPQKMADIDAQIAALENQGRQLFQTPAATAAVPSVPEAGPRAFIGDPLAQPAPAATEAPTITSKAQFDALPKGATYIGRNGKRYRKP